MSTNGRVHDNFVDAIHDTLPHSQEAEQAVLGGILVNSDAYYEVSDFLRHDHFYSVLNGEVFRAVGNLLAERMPADMVTLAELLKARQVRPVKDSLEVYLLDLISFVPNSMHTVHYARIVESMAVRRRLIHAGYKVRALASDENMPIDTLIEQSEGAVFGVSDGMTDGRMQSISDGMSELYDQVQARRANGGQFVGVPSGLIDLDKILRGFKPTRLYILAGRPGMGKSMLANEFALNMAGKYGKRGAIFNLEMSRTEVNERFAANRAVINLQQLEEGRLDDDEFERFQHATGATSRLPLHIDDTTNLTPAQLRAKCRRIQAEYGLDFVIIDYLQLMTAEGKHGTREQEIADISRQLKRLAKDLEVPVIALAQLSRSLENRSDKRPALSDLRESGDIENNADCVMFLYRDEYYSKENCERPNQAEVEISKHRNGPTGRANLHFNGALMQFRNLARPVNL